MIYGNVGLACLIIATLLSTTESNVSPFDPSTITLTMQQKTPTLFLLTSPSSSSSSPTTLYQFHKAAQQFYQSHPSRSPEHTQIPSQRLLFVVSDSNDGLFTFEKLAEFLGVGLGDTPVVVYLTAGHVKYRFWGDRAIDAQGVLEFVKGVQQGTVPVFYKSEPEEMDEKGGKRSYVRKLVGKNYDKLVLGSEKQQFVLFYTPLCYKSRTLNLHFQKSAESLQKNPNIQFSSLNLQKNELPPQTLPNPIPSPPFILFYPKDKSQPPIPYSLLNEYEKSYDYMIRWLKERTGYRWVRSGDVSGDFVEEL